jgi:hypothetical protein
MNNLEQLALAGTAIWFNKQAGPMGVAASETGNALSNAGSSIWNGVKSLGSSLGESSGPMGVAASETGSALGTGAKAIGNISTGLAKLTTPLAGEGLSQIAHPTGFNYNGPSPVLHDSPASSSGTPPSPAATPAPAPVPTPSPSALPSPGPAPAPPSTPPPAAVPPAPAAPTSSTATPSVSVNGQNTPGMVASSQSPAPPVQSAPAPASNLRPIDANLIAHFRQQTGSHYNPNSVADRTAMLAFQRGATGAQAQQASSLAGRRQMMAGAGTAANNTSMLHGMNQIPGAMRLPGTVGGNFPQQGGMLAKSGMTHWDKMGFAMMHVVDRTS